MENINIDNKKIWERLIKESSECLMFCQIGTWIEDSLKEQGLEYKPNVGIVEIDSPQWYMCLKTHTRGFNNELLYEKGKLYDHKNDDDFKDVIITADFNAEYFRPATEQEILTKEFQDSDPNYPYRTDGLKTDTKKSPEAKFKEGDWLVYLSCPVVVTKVGNDCYYLNDGKEEIELPYSLCEEAKLRKWQISDAKDGDVLKVKAAYRQYAKQAKFKAGDYVISTKNPDIKYRINGTDINELCERDYICEDVSGGEFCGKFRKITASKLDEWARLWTIQDAKDGDVLINWNNTIFIFKAIEDETVKFHIAYNEKWNAIKTPSTKLSHLGLPEPQFEFHPATKEQKDILFEAIAEAGFSWNAETKTLEKIQKPDLDNTNGTNTIRFDKEEELTEFENKIASLLFNNKDNLVTVLGAQRIAKKASSDLLAIAENEIRKKIASEVGQCIEDVLKKIGEC